MSRVLGGLAVSLLVVISCGCAKPATQSADPLFERNVAGTIARVEPVYVTSHGSGVIVGTWTGAVGGGQSLEHSNAYRIVLDNGTRLLVGGDLTTKGITSQDLKAGAVLNATYLPIGANNIVTSINVRSGGCPQGPPCP